KAGRGAGAKSGRGRSSPSPVGAPGGLRRDDDSCRGPLMTVALWLLTVQGAIGAFDTLYYHEWRAPLPARVPQTDAELKLHAVRDFLYAVLFGTLPWLAWQGLWVLVLSAVLLAEIVLTLSDFVVESRVRKHLGDVYAGERVTHAVMGILYGAMI